MTRDMEKLCNLICDEIDKIAEKGLTTSNLETAYKLVDMYKDLKDAEYHDIKREYYEQEMGMDGYSGARRRDNMGRYSRLDGRIMDEYDHGNSYARRGEHYVRGHYSRDNAGNAYNDYMMEKQSYRTGGKSIDCKQRMLGALEDHLNELVSEISGMIQDADCAEEREKLVRFADKLKKVM